MTKIEGLQFYELANGNLLAVEGIVWIMQRQNAPQSPQEPIRDAQAPEPSPQPKRKRGRPPKAKTETLADKVYAQNQLDEPASPTFQLCRYCHRELPTEVLPAHEENCRIAAIGYATHVASPGDKP